MPGFDHLHLGEVERDFQVHRKQVVELAGEFQTEAIEGEALDALVLNQTKVDLQGEEIRVAIAHVSISFRHR